MELLKGFSILVVDDHPLFREGLALALLQRQPGLRLSTAATLAGAMDLLATQADDIDLVLLDYRLQGENGLAGATRIRSRYPAIACALMSGLDELGLSQRARAAGLAGYFSKSLEVDRLLQGLARLAGGESWFEDRATIAPSTGGLTPRQQEIVRLAAGGASNKVIAQALGIAPHTVKNHLAQIFERLGASNRAQAVLLAHEPNRD